MSVPVASFPFLHIDAWKKQDDECVKLQVVKSQHKDGAVKWILEVLTYVVDEAGPVPVLDDLHSSDSAPSVQREALAPAWDSVRVDPLPDPHGAPESRRNEGKTGIRSRMTECN